MRRPFTKMQGVGNDFVVLEGTDWSGEHDWPALAQRLCDRKFGAGADGLLLIGDSEIADLRMRMFNPDGTEDMCGNGLRCVIVRARARGRLPKERGTVDCRGEIYAYAVRNDRLWVRMNAPKFSLSALPAVIPGKEADYIPSALEVETDRGTVVVDAANTGSTHAVIWCDTLPADAEFFSLGPRIEHSTPFPERTSVLWAVAENDSTLRLRIWERGVGETLGCGTGACAAAALALRRGRVRRDEVTVLSRGGALIVHCEGGDITGPLWLTGPAETVYCAWVEA